MNYVLAKRPLWTLRAKGHPQAPSAYKVSVQPHSDLMFISCKLYETLNCRGEEKKTVVTAEAAVTMNQNYNHVE